jgi:hypothetical protein
MPLLLFPFSAWYSSSRYSDWGRLDLDAGELERTGWVGDANGLHLPRERQRMEEPARERGGTAICSVTR